MSRFKAFHGFSVSTMEAFIPDAQQSVLMRLLWRTIGCGFSCGDAAPMSNVLLLWMEKNSHFSSKVYSARDSRMGVYLSCVVEG